MRCLPDADRVRVVKCLNLSQSDKPGEVIAAVTGANRVLAKHGLSWDEVIITPTGGLREAMQPAAGLSWRITARELLRRCDELTMKEHGFVLDVLKLSHLSERQAAWLEAIEHRILRNRTQP